MDRDLCHELPGQVMLAQEVSDFSFESFNPVDSGFEKHSLYEYLNKGKWVVLFFYPGDFTFVCPTELADLAEKHDKMKELGVEIISVSTDSKYAHLTWKRSEKLLENVNFQMAADNTGCISRYFGVYDNAAGSAYRGTFIIGPDHILVSKEVNYYNVGRNADELVRKLEANIYVSKNPAEVCPAKWQPGKTTLTPSEKIVNKVYDAIPKVGPV